MASAQDFTDKEDWNDFYTSRGIDDSFDWYAGWPEIGEFIVNNLVSVEISASVRKNRAMVRNKLPLKVRVLVPGCGNSGVSGKLYDRGFRNIVNVDFSEVVIYNMTRQNLRTRPGMKWRVMDMTSLKFPNESFDAVVEKGALDSLFHNNLYPGLAHIYLSEVKRVLKYGGKYVCLSLAESHVLDLLFHKFRFGWDVAIHAIASRSAERIVGLVFEKQNPRSVSIISTFLNGYSAESHGDEDHELLEVLNKEQQLRKNYINGKDMTYSVEDILLGAAGNVRQIEAGATLKLILGETGVSSFTYRAEVFDSESQENTVPYAVFVIPKLRALNRLYSSEEGPSNAVASTMTKRRLMVFLDSSNSISSREEIQTDLFNTVKQLAPADFSPAAHIPFFIADDGVKDRQTVHQVMSLYLRSPILVEDVVYEVREENGVCSGRKCRRLIFQRSEDLVQSEALLSTQQVPSEAAKEATEAKNKGKQQISDPGSSMAPASSGETEIDHGILASGYHNAIISGILTISSYFTLFTPHAEPVKTVILGLGGGLLPMFIKKNIPALKMEVVELDPAVQCIATDFFGFKEDQDLRVHIGDAIDFIKGKNCSKVDILVLDVDLSDRSSGLSCPNPGFLEESFLRAAADSLSDQGVFVMNLITGSSSTRLGAYSRLKKVFCKILRTEVEEDVSEVLFALKTNHPMTKDEVTDARYFIQGCKYAVDFTNSIEPLR